MPLGPPVFEFILSKLLRKPLVLDLDDATYVRYISPTFGRLAGILKCFQKTDTVIGWSRVVICGNDTIAKHATDLGASSVVIPTIVDTGCFRPSSRLRRADVPVLGWVGSHSTFRYLESIFPALQRVACSRRFRLLIVGSGREDVAITGVDTTCRAWSLPRELADFQEIDIGLYPIVAEEWSTGKSGFKAIQYMSLAVPFVMSPVGICARIGQAGTTHQLASTIGQWHDAVANLVDDADLRVRMGRAGRVHVQKHYSVRRRPRSLPAR